MKTAITEAQTAENRQLSSQRVRVEGFRLTRDDYPASRWWPANTWRK